MHEQCCCLHNKPWIGMSSELVGSAQHGSEHSNWQLLASSFLALCMIFLSPLAFFFFTATSYLYGCVYKMFTASTDLYVWQSTFKFNHVLETINPWKRNSCKQNENIVLHKSSLWLVHLVPICTDIYSFFFLDWFHCGEIIIVPSESVSYTQAIRADPKQPLNPAFNMNDSLSIWRVLCWVSMSRVTVLCSFLCCLWGGSHLCDWSLLHCEPSSQRSTEVLNYTSPMHWTMCVSVCPWMLWVHMWPRVYVFSWPYCHCSGPD